MLLNYPWHSGIRDSLEEASSITIEVDEEPNIPNSCITIAGECNSITSPLRNKSLGEILNSILSEEMKTRWRLQLTICVLEVSRWWERQRANQMVLRAFRLGIRWRGLTSKGFYIRRAVRCSRTFSLVVSRSTFWKGCSLSLDFNTSAFLLSNSDLIILIMLPIKLTPYPVNTTFVSEFY